MVIVGFYEERRQGVNIVLLDISEFFIKQYKENKDTQLKL